jgi:SAM-dependent methyltransferase
MIKKSTEYFWEWQYHNFTPHDWEDEHDYLEMDSPCVCTSMLCNRSFFDLPLVWYWMKRLGERSVVYHRKQWEYAYICQALYERGSLQSGKRGLVFGVGKEPLPSLFASLGCNIVATDLSLDEATEQGWCDNIQHIESKTEELNERHLCSPDIFAKNVTYREVNMNNIPTDLKEFDFCWSSCALEHIGGIENGLRFIENSVKTLKPGGIAVHTTEYNLFSIDETLESKGLSLFRRKDIEDVIERLVSNGHYVWPMNWHIGKSLVDNFVDLPPYHKKRMNHLRILISRYPCTSIGLIIKRCDKD